MPLLPPVPTATRPSTGTPLLTPVAVIAPESSPQSLRMSVQIQLIPRPSPTTPQWCRKEGVRDPRRRPNRHRRRPGHHRRRPRREELCETGPEDCCLCYEALVTPKVHLGSCPSRLHRPWYAALCVRGGTNLRCPAPRATVTVEEADRRVSRQHSNEVLVEELTNARGAINVEGGGEPFTKASRSGRGGRVTSSIFHGVVEETAFIHVPC